VRRTSHISLRALLSSSTTSMLNISTP